MDGALGRGLNRVVLVGCLGRAPEMRYTPSGKPVTSFSIVTTHNWISSNHQIQEETDCKDSVSMSKAGSRLDVGTMRTMIPTRGPKLSPKM